MLALNEEKIRLSFKAVVLLAMLLFVALVALIDYTTRGELGFSVLYIFLVAIGAWSSGVAVSAIVAVSASVLWTFTMTSMGLLASHEIIPYLNLVMHLSALLLVVYGISRLRSVVINERRMLHRDPLTGIANGQAFYEDASRELSRSKRYSRQLTVVAVSCDDFKAINKKYGFEEGDEVLKVIARTLRELIRESDVCARFSGDEFMLLLAETDFNGAAILLKRLRLYLENSMKDNGWELSFSIAVETFEELPLSVDDLIRNVDELMLDMKKIGKNSVQHKLYTQK